MVTWIAITVGLQCLKGSDIACPGTGGLTSPGMDSACAGIDPTAADASKSVPAACKAAIPVPCNATIASHSRRLLSSHPRWFPATARSFDFVETQAAFSPRQTDHRSPSSHGQQRRLLQTSLSGFHVSDASFNYDGAGTYCKGKSMTLASIYTAEELAEARAVIKAKGVDKAITSATADGIGWKWRGGTEYWTHDKFPLNTGDVTDGADGNFQGMYSLHGDGDFVWDADGLHEKHPALCRDDCCAVYIFILFVFLTECMQGLMIGLL
jgi:hypothetical protein